MRIETPLIKGMFVNSHLRKLREDKGEEAVLELERRYGKSVSFRNLDDVPVAEEVRIIEIVLDLISGKVLDEPERSFEAGRLHFRNFAKTPYGRIILSALPRTRPGFKDMLLRARYIASHVFKHTNFQSFAGDGHELTVIMENNDYPIDHFRGLFYEWMVYWGIEGGSVRAKETEPRRYVYTLRF